jgi:hypothetical protein
MDLIMTVLAGILKRFINWYKLLAALLLFL